MSTTEKRDIHVVLDREFVIPMASPVCSLCLHFDEDNPDNVCSAFPNGIPMQIWAGLNTHEQPYPGDCGIRFAPVPGAKLTSPQAPDPKTIERLESAGLLPEAAFVRR